MRRYHHTSPIQTMYALREGLAILAEEVRTGSLNYMDSHEMVSLYICVCSCACVLVFQGLEASWNRHKECAKLLHDGISDLHLEFLVANPVCYVARACMDVVQISNVFM